MIKHQNQPADAAELRRRAQDRLQTRERTPQAAQQLVHELRVHQIELEMQNEELRQARAQLCARVAQYIDLFEFAPTGYVTLDREGVIRQANLEVARLFGVERSRLLKRRFGLFIADDNRLAFSDALQKVFAGQAKECCEVTLPRAGQHPLSVRIEGTRSADEQECLAVVVDLTAHKQAEAALRESEQQFRAMFDMASIGIAQADVRTGQWLRVNPKMCEITGYSASELLQMRVSELTHPEDRQPDWEAFQRVVRDEAPDYRMEKRYLRKDGSLAWVNVNMTVLRDAAGHPTRTMATIEDVTERRQADEALRQSQQQLRALSARLETLREEDRTRIAREIHDVLGQTLTCIKMDLRWMEHHLDAFGEDRRVNPVLDKLVATTQLTDDLVTAVQRIAAELRPGILDNLGLPMTLQYEAARFEERTGIACRTILPGDEPSLRPNAATAFFRIFQEALTNVARHAHATAVEVELRTEAEGCFLEIRDNGRGMAGSSLAKPNSLGLLGMRERAALLGGRVSFVPRPGGGTVVTVQIPNASTGEDGA